MTDSSKLLQTANDFVDSIRAELEEYPRILANADQSAIQMESSHGCTLALVGKILWQVEFDLQNLQDYFFNSKVSKIFWVMFKENQR